MKIRDDGNIAITDDYLADGWSSKSRNDVSAKLEFLQLENKESNNHDEVKAVEGNDGNIFN